jgi:RimJ/RimL family protein N-acetyltransferase
MPPEPTVRLRPAEPGDEARLLGWRNDPAVRAASFSDAEVAPDEHHRWFSRKLEDPATALYVVEVDGEPAGQVRLDDDGDGSAEISIALAGAARGAGAGRRALRLALAEAGQQWPGVDVVIARVKPGNEQSLRSFAAAGFAESRRSDEAVELRAPVAR